MKWMRTSIAWSRRMSPPSRGAWIEIRYVDLKEYANEVAPLAGGVD